MAPRHGFAIDEKTSRILGSVDFSSLEIPPKTPLLKGGCCRTLSDVSESARSRRGSNLTHAACSFRSGYVSRSVFDSVAAQSKESTFRSDVRFRLCVIKEVIREHGQSQVCERFSELNIAPTTLLSSLPRTIGDISRIGRCFPDHSGDRLHRSVARRCA